MWIGVLWQEGVATDLIYQSADVLLVLSEDEEALLPIVGAHGQGEHVKARLRTLKLVTNGKFYASKLFIFCDSKLFVFCDSELRQHCYNCHI